MPLPPSIAPRGLSWDEAAEYVGVSTDILRQAVDAGMVHRPVRWGARRLVFDRRRLDLDLDRLYEVAGNEAGPSAETIMLERIRRARANPLRREAV